MRYANESQTLAETNRLLQELMGSQTECRVLEAGCGRKTHIELDPRAFIVGIDIEPSEIGRNGRLSEALVGDIQSYPFEPSSFDLAVCWNVLEHLQEPVRALDNMHAALRREGSRLLVLGVPNVQSLKTLAVKLTPRRLHKRIWHWLYPWADPNDDGPFPVVLSPSMSLAGLDRYARERNMTVVYRSTYESAMQTQLRRRLRIGDRWWRAFSFGLRALSAGKIDAWHSDAVVILRKD